MPERPDSHVKRRTMLTMFRKPFEQTYPIAQPDAEEQELRALLEKAEHRTKSCLGKG